MTINKDVFTGCIPALMTPCDSAGVPDMDALVESGRRMISHGMSAVVYCGSMGDWPLLTNAQRQDGVARLVGCGDSCHRRDRGPVACGGGLPCRPCAGGRCPGSHGDPQGALQRDIAQRSEGSLFRAVLSAAGDVPAVIYNSPYYGFETRADLFFELHDAHPNLIGYKEFGGAAALSYAAEHITSGSDDLSLLVGVDTQVVHGFVNCGAVGAITGIGNALPDEILHLVRLSELAANGDSTAHRLALELENAMTPLCVFDEGPDLVLYFKHLMVLRGFPEYQHSVHPTDSLSTSQRAFATTQMERFTTWWESWDGSEYRVE